MAVKKSVTKTNGKETIQNGTGTKKYGKSLIKDPMAATWLEKYDSVLQAYWDKIPGFIGTIIASVAVFILGSTIRGEWLHILVHFLRAFYIRRDTSQPRAVNNSTIRGINGSSSGSILFGIDLEEYYLKDLGFFWLTATSVSYICYLGIGGFLHWYYYVRRRDSAHEWKCQPDKWLSPDLERHEILLGSFSLLLGSTMSAIISSYVINGGPTTIYYDIKDYGWLWYFLSWPIVFIWQDYLTYWHHRIYHLPFLYKHFHKLHHKYKQPTAFSVTAIHPVEFLHMQMVLITPMFLYPVHWSVFCTILMYLYYHGIIDHSGINFKAYFWQPWQPDCIFHDNHHQYFHVNFGFNCELWDKIHGTYRQKNKIYREDIFYGKGKDIDDCSKEELKEDLMEREAENPLAYRTEDTKNEQVEEIIKKIK